MKFTYGPGPRKDVARVASEDPLCAEPAEEAEKPEDAEEQSRGFKLIETMLWIHGPGYYLYDLHLERLAASAKLLKFKYDEKAVSSELDEIASLFERDKKYKVRLLLSKDGTREITHEIMGAKPLARLPKIALSPDVVDSKDILLFHKTTYRQLYNENLERFKYDGFYDVLFRNERGELTEGAWNNVILKIDGELLTPPVECGLLNGVFRKFMISNGRLKERITYADDLASAEAIFCCNSVRGIVSVSYVAQ